MTPKELAAKLAVMEHRIDTPEGQLAAAALIESALASTLVAARMVAVNRAKLWHTYLGDAALRRSEAEIIAQEIGTLTPGTFAARGAKLTVRDVRNIVYAGRIAPLNEVIELTEALNTALVQQSDLPEQS